MRKNDFDWHSAGWKLHVPMISALFEQVATRSKLEPLGLVEVLDWTAAALNRVDRAAFFERFVEDHAVQYFYEPFLEAFDPELRKELGVWYTPPEIVQYQVARVDAALREELDIPDGLADPRVFVLDPCCGTGAYLVEVLKHIHKFLKEDQGMGALSEHYTKEAAQKRIFGFELLPAPFVISHLQMGLLLQNLGVPLDDSKSERAAIYLTNALTGWEPPSEEAKKQLSFTIPEFKQEKEAADGIKQETKIIVILGNPPYNGFAGVAVEEERDLSDAYRTTKRAPAPQGQGLNDLYVRFYRMAERRIVEKSGEGVVSFISNYSWLDGLSFTGMREKYLEVFDSITIDCLNGDKFKTGKLTPERQPDPSVFSTEFNREGIQVGTAIASLVRRRRSEEAQTPKKKSKNPTSSQAGEVQFRNLWGKNKRADLLASLNEPIEKIYSRLKPPLQVGLPLLPTKTESGYFKWPLLTELFPTSFPGVKTSRDDFLVDVEKDALVKRLEKYFDPQISHEEMKRIAPTVMENSARFMAEPVRDELRKRGFLKKNVVRYLYRPFDVRWLYWEPETKLLDEKRTDYFLQIFEGNVWFSAGQRNRKEDFYQPQFTSTLADHHIVESNVGMFPLWLKPNPDPLSLFDRASDGKPKPNLSDAATEYLADLRLGNQPELLFYHTMAMLHSLEYRVDNAGALRQDWPRVPLSKSRDALLASATLGRRVASLLDTVTQVDGITKGKPSQEFREIAELNFSGSSNLKITAGWGHAGQNGVTMPGKGKIISSLLEAGPNTAWHELHDVYLNESACWKNIPAPVWDYTIGGYQVIKKWLSYREFELLGRPLTPDEAREVTQMARRIAALILLQPELDKNYQAVKAAAVPL